MSDVLESEVALLLGQLDVRKSTGSDAISNYVLKSCATELVPVMTLCVNKCIQTGTFPDILKTARVSPVYKGGTMHFYCRNFMQLVSEVLRMISLLTI